MDGGPVVVARPPGQVLGTTQDTRLMPQQL